MCFSIEASFASAVVVGGVGAATLMNVREPRELLLGALPLMFAVHQLDEGTVWLSLEGRFWTPWQNWGAWLYILFAQALVPAIVPWCMWLAEPDKKHRRLLVPFLVLGAGLCGFALWELSGHPGSAEIRGQGIEYDSPLNDIWWFAALYIVATCMPPFLSSYPWMITFGVLNVGALIAAALFKSIYFTSVWCLFAAVLSILVYLHFRRVRRLQSIPCGPVQPS